MDKVVFTGKLFTMFAVGKIFPAGFAINIPLPVNDVVIFIVDEVFPAVGALFQVFVPAFRAEMKLPVDFEFFRRSADVTFHDSLHWLVVTTTRRRFAGNHTPSNFPFAQIPCIMRPGTSLLRFEGKSEQHQGMKKSRPE